MASTILDVAKLSGYSKTTVSRAFSSPETVPDSTRNKIFEAAKILNYTPNAIARAMVRRRTDNIAFVLDSQQYPAILNPFYSPILETVLRTLTKRNYSMFISPDTDLRLASGELYFKKQMDGVILAGHSDVHTILGLKQQNIPVVLLNNVLDMDDLVCVIPDHYYSAQLAMDHLIDRGHRRIGLIAGRFSPYTYSARYNAYMDALRRHELPVDYRFIQSIEPTMETACQCVSTILSMPDHPSALFCTNDTIAIGAVKAALRMQVKIPDEIAVVGIDDSPMSTMIEPELTTVHIDTEAMGRLAAETLIALMNGQPVESNRLQVGSELVVRGTT